MGPLPTIIDDEALKLDPLDGVLGNIQPPFPSPFTLKVTPPFCRSPSIPFPRLPSSKKPFDETPTTAAASLPTPRPPALTLIKPSYADVVRGYGDLDHLSWYSHHNDDDAAAYLADPKKDDAMPSCPPDAPLVKDIDSFTDGTYAGSFDFSLYSLDDVAPSYSQVDARPTPQSLAFSPEAPLRSIENWREDVLTSTGVVPHNVSLEIDGDVVEPSTEPSGRGDLGPRGIKRHLSWTSDAYRDHDGGPERARGRWEVLKAPSSNSDALYSYAFYGDHVFDKQAYEPESDGLLYSGSTLEEDLGYVSDDVFIPPARPSSAPPYT